MHAEVYKKYEEILSKFRITGKVLEVGAIPNKKSLLASKTLNSASEKIGINLDGPSTYDNFKILKGNANNMENFDDGKFDCVLCNATLEHDKFFWKSISEMKRVLKKDGLLIIGAPSYVSIKKSNNVLIKKLLKLILKKYIKVEDKKSTFAINAITFCIRLHNYPGDYYRYSEQTFKDVFFDGFKDVIIETFMIPPRTIGYGLKV